ncbi:MAG: hypothetical protein HQK55_14425 [Deltaproteobacteria bacterium]|nr:hypothetical protein [Deltaproteobacteria bacterium]
MIEPETDNESVIIEPDGTVILSERIMSEYVMATPGVNLWFNGSAASLGIRFLRGVDDPPYPIERLPGSEGAHLGRLAAGSFLAKVGAKLSSSTRTYPCRYYHQYHMLEIRLGPKPEKPAIGRYLDEQSVIED